MDCNVDHYKLYYKSYLNPVNHSPLSLFSDPIDILYCTFDLVKNQELKLWSIIPDNIEAKPICSIQNKIFDEGIYKIKPNEEVCHFIGDWLLNQNAINISVKQTIKLPDCKIVKQFQQIYGAFYIIKK